IEEKNQILLDKDVFVQKLRDEFEESVINEKKEIIENAKQEAMIIAKDAENALKDIVDKTLEYNTNIENLTAEHEALLREVNRYRNQARKFKSEVLGLKNFDERFPHTINFDGVEKKIDEL